MWPETLLTFFNLKMKFIVFFMSHTGSRVLLYLCGNMQRTSTKR